MARRTFAEFDTELNLSLGKRTDFTAAIRLFVLSSAYYHVANIIRHPELEVIATAVQAITTDTVALPSDFWFPELIFNDTDNQPIRPSAVPLIEAVGKPSGNPATYTRWGSALYFDKISTAAKNIRIWYTKRPLEPAGAASSVLDVLYDQLILLYAVKFGFEELRDFEQAAKTMIAIKVLTAEIRPPWRMTKTEDSKKSISVRMR